MHEIGMFQDELTRALACVSGQHKQHVQRVMMRIGTESGVNLDVIAQAFSVLTHGTIAAGAELMIEQVAAVCHCPACGTTFMPTDSLHRCPSCRQLGVKLRQGSEFAITALDLEQE